MPGTLWSAPSAPLNSAPLVTSSFVTATLTDISPGQCLIPAGLLNLGTRVRIVAAGSYIATTTASTITWGLYMNGPTSSISTTPAILGVSPGVAAVAVSGNQWLLQYWGKIAAISTTTGSVASIVGHGEMNLGTGLATAMAVYPVPITLLGMTVAQTATGMITNVEQNIMVGASVATNTGLTSITTDELTCELIG